MDGMPAYLLAWLSSLPVAPAGAHVSPRTPSLFLALPPCSTSGWMASALTMMTWRACLVMTTRGRM